MKLYNVNIDEGYVIPAKNHGSPRSSVRASSKSTLGKDCTLAFPLCTRLQCVFPSACNGSTIPSSLLAVVFLPLSLLPRMSDNPLTNARSRKTRILLSLEAAAALSVAISPQRR